MKSYFGRRQYRQRFKVAALVLAIVLAGCGVQSQQTPEPSEIERVTQLIEQLGTQQSYNSKTLLWNRKPDGLVMRDWMERRAATLNGTLAIGQIPALMNPGSVKETIAWEIAANRAERDRLKAITDYKTNFALHREEDCLNTTAEERAWFQRRLQKDPRTTKPNDDWREMDAQWQAKCDAERNAVVARGVAEQAREKSYEAAGLELERKCREPWIEADRVYTESPSAETGSAVTAAAEAMDRCLSGRE